MRKIINTNLTLGILTLALSVVQIITMLHYNVTDVMTTLLMFESLAIPGMFLTAFGIVDYSNGIYD